MKLLTPCLHLLNRSRLIRVVILAMSLLALGFLPNAKASAPPSASGTLTETSISAGSDTFALSLTNTGGAVGSPIETFWFGSTSTKDYLDSEPSNVTTPTGWTDSIVNNGGSDGYSIKFTTTNSADEVTHGNTLTGFGFTSADSFSQMAGNSVFYSGSAATTSVVSVSSNYTGSPSNPFVVTVSVPEPASVALVAAGALWLSFCKRRRQG
jgi:hypothetical protein